VKYAPVKYPGLADDVRDLLNVVLGEGVFEPVIDVYLKKLRSTTRAKMESSSEQKRHTPRYLRIIATPDDQQQPNLEAEAQGDVAVLKWCVVESYVGSA
jgi:hypothetical protein